MAGKNKKNSREETLDWLTTNSESFGAPEVRDSLSELPEDVLAEIAANAEFAAEKMLICNAVAEQWPEINEIVGNGGDIKAFLASKFGSADGDDPDDEDNEDSQTEPVPPNARGKRPMTNGEGEQEKTVANQNKSARRQSFTEMLAERGTPEEKAVWNHAVDTEREVRAKLLRRITANCENDAERKEMWNGLKGLDLPQLKLMANRLAPAEPAEQQNHRGLFGVGRRIPDYGAAAGAAPMTGNRRSRSDEDDDELDLPNTRSILANESQA